MQLKKMTYAMLLAAGCCLATPSLAQSQPLLNSPTQLPVEITVDNLQQLIQEHNPTLQQERIRLEPVLANIIEAGLRPNPELSLGMGNHTYGENPLDGHEYEVMIETPLWLSGQREAKIATAESRLTEAEANFAVIKAEVNAEARSLFIHLLALQQKDQIYRHLRDDLAGIQHNIEGRVAAGDMSAYDLVRLNVELSELEQTHTEIQIEQDTLTQSLAQLFGVETANFTVKGEMTFHENWPEFNELWHQTEQNLPNLELARRGIAASRLAVDQADKERRITPTLGVGMVHTTDARGGAAVVSLSMEMPIFDRGQGKMAIANAELSTAMMDQQIIQHQARAELQRVITKLKQHRQALSRFETSVVDQLPQLRQQAESAYQYGESSIVDLLDAFESLANAQLNQVDLKQAVMLAELDLLNATGLLLNSDVHAD